MSEKVSCCGRFATVAATAATPCFGGGNECENSAHDRRHRTRFPEDSEVLPMTDLAAQLEDTLRRSYELENRIETAIDNIHKRSLDAREKVTRSFVEAHEKLNAEEVAVMKELEEACCSAEDSLREMLGSIKEARTRNGIPDKMSRADQKQCFNLMEPSVIEAQIRAMKELHEARTTDLVFYWDDADRRILFKKRLINGVPDLSDIRFSNVFGKSIDISWSCDEDELDEEDKKELKFVVEAKKATDEKWECVYSGRNKKCNVDRLDIDTEYNVRIRCAFKGSYGEWSGITNVRTKNFAIGIDSLILAQEKNKEYLYEKLSEWCDSKGFELLYRGTRDGFHVNDFHRMCDNKGRSLTLLKNASGHIFGGFASVSWDSPLRCTYMRAPGSFLFTLTNMYEIEPTKFLLRDEDCACAVEHDEIWGPIFGSGRDLIISSYCNTNNSYTAFPRTYIDPTGKGRSIFTSDASTINNSFQLHEIEVFKVI